MKRDPACAVPAEPRPIPGGSYEIFFAQSSAAVQHVKSGSVVALGVASARRTAGAPELATMARWAKLAKEAKAD